MLGGEDKSTSREARKESRSLGIFKGVSNKPSPSPTTDTPAPPPAPSGISLNIPQESSSTLLNVPVPISETSSSGKPEKTTKTTATYYPKLSRNDSLISRKDSAITTTSLTKDDVASVAGSVSTRTGLPRDVVVPQRPSIVLGGEAVDDESGDEAGQTEWRSPTSVALKPYSHQVGGHNALFRFSRHAVCKPLIEKENAFYQDIEINRPELLPFMPRYIGTLNVTYTDYPTSDSSPPSPLSLSPTSHSPKASPATSPASHVTPVRNITPLPEVQIDKNRHIIPKWFLQNRKQSTSTPVSPSKKVTIPQPASNATRTVGIGGVATTINYKLQEQVLREVFAPTRRPKKKRHDGNIPHSHSPSHQSPAIGLAHSPLNSGTEEVHRVATVQSFPDLKKGKEHAHMSSSSLDLRKVATSAARAKEEEDQSLLRRRHSVGNLREVVEEHDSDENMFAMDEDASTPPSVARDVVVETSVEETGEIQSNGHGAGNWAERCFDNERSKIKKSDMPGNPQVHVVDGSNSRTEWFLLIENLTKNMIRPCVLDLKMGTRQYGYISSSHNCPEGRH